MRNQLSGKLSAWPRLGVVARVRCRPRISLRSIRQGQLRTGATSCRPSVAAKLDAHIGQEKARPLEAWLPTDSRCKRAGSSSVREALCQELDAVGVSALALGGNVFTYEACLVDRQVNPHAEALFALRMD